MRTFAGPGELAAAAGERLGASEFRPVEQPEIATLTGDRQWIHVDRDRAAAGPIAHGFTEAAIATALDGQPRPAYTAQTCPLYQEAPCAR